MLRRYNTTLPAGSLSRQTALASPLIARLLVTTPIRVTTRAREPTLVANFRSERILTEITFLSHLHLAGRTQSDEVIPVPARLASTSTCPSGPLAVYVCASMADLLGPSGGTYSITFCYASVSTTYGYVANAPPVTTSETQFTDSCAARWDQLDFFYYDSWGNLSQITFPTGGTLAYGWTQFVLRLGERGG